MISLNDELNDLTYFPSLLELSQVPNLIYFVIILSKTSKTLILQNVFNLLLKLLINTLTEIGQRIISLLLN